MFYIKNNGYKNEWDFFNYLHKKKVGEVNLLFRNFLYDNFLNINDSMTIRCFVDLGKEKTDLWIKIGRQKLNVSIKMGKENSVHTEYIYSFVAFLEKEKVPSNIINFILEYQLAGGFDNCYKKYFGFIEYKNRNSSSINLVNKYFMNNEVLLLKLVDRFVTKGIDVLVHGTVDDFVYIKKNEIIKVLMDSRFEKSTAIHFSHLYYQSKSRNDEIKRFFLQIKWYNLKEDILRVRQKEKSF